MSRMLMVLVLVGGTGCGQRTLAEVGERPEQSGPESGAQADGGLPRAEGASEARGEPLGQPLAESGGGDGTDTREGAGALSGATDDVLVEELRAETEGEQPDQLSEVDLLTCPERYPGEGDRRGFLLSCRFDYSDGASGVARGCIDYPTSEGWDTPSVAAHCVARGAQVVPDSLRLAGPDTCYEERREQAVTRCDMVVEGRRAYGYDLDRYTCEVFRGGVHVSGPFCAHLHE